MKDLDSSESGSSSHSGTSGLDTSTSGNSKRSSSEGSDSYKNNLSGKETKDVERLKCIVIIALILAAVGVSVVVFMITRKSEQDEYESQYEATALKLMKSYEGMVARMGTLSNVGMAATIQGMDTNMTWPFVTLTAFQQRAATARSLSAALYVTISPFVTDADRNKWESYVTESESSWIAEGLAYQERLGTNIYEYDAPSIDELLKSNDDKTEKAIFYFDDQGEPQVDEGPGPYLVTWETSPVLRKGLVNENLFKRSDVSALVKDCLEEEAVILGGFQVAPRGRIDSPDPLTAFFATLRSFRERKETEYLGDPMARLYIPVFDNFSEDRKAVGVVVSVIHFTEYFRDLLPNTIKGLTVVLENSCDGNYTYTIDGTDAIPVGFGDLHDPNFDQYMRYASFANQYKIADGTEFGIDLSQLGCQYNIRVYPSNTFYNIYNTNMPIIITFAVAMVFLFTVFMFWMYDRIVEKRQQHVLNKAAQTNKIVSSLFPKQVRDRLMDNDDLIKEKTKLLSGKHQIKSFLTGDGSNAQRANSQIADLFPACTVLFADIAGFTAWSSAREPEQVFILLQTVYKAFDALAKRRNVFKVETIGDCYVAATGLPEAQPKHAVIMSRFAYECKHRMRQLVRELECRLGPDTGELSIRMGMNSGPVTAGVLVGSNARFQLFGDTVNTAARMESTGIKDKIHVSKATAEELISAGKEHWLRPRTEVNDKNGKALGIQTFWLHPINKGGRRSADGGSETASSNGESVTGSGHETVDTEADKVFKRERLVEWMLEIMLDHVKKCIERRRALGETETLPSIALGPKDGSTYLDEVEQVITLSRYDPRAATIALKQPEVLVSPELVNSLREYINIISMAYRDNAFHNFEHACHVTMSVNKLLKRVIAPTLDEMEIKELEEKGEDIGEHLHHYTDGINTDPLAMFAVVFSSMIHDVDHRGVSNVQLAKEEKGMAIRYRHKSIAEQNSLDVALDLLMSDQFAPLRQFVFGSNEEMIRFRQLVVQAVLATDIFDKELNDVRKRRWSKAFAKKHEGVTEDHQSGLKATIVIEHMMQASDISHTMQHWHVYCKWNRRLFREMYTAYRDGRMGADPSTFWYKGELGFFDNYVIPLAEKLKECNVFGVSSDEYLNYALSNRMEWEERGEYIIEEMMMEIQPQGDQGVSEIAVDLCDNVMPDNKDDV